MDNDLQKVVQWIGIAAGILVLLSWISFYVVRLLNKDLSDQTGWENFAKPFIGISIFIITILFVILIVLVLLGVI